jgi:hypothetical protein
MLVNVYAAIGSKCGERLHFEDPPKLSNIPEVMDWESWRETFGKVYDSDEILEHRKVFSISNQTDSFYTWILQ